MTSMFYFRIGVAAIGFAFAVLWGAVIMLVTRDADRVRDFVAPRVQRYLCWAARVTVRMHNAHILDDARGAVIVPNQQSIICYGILAHAFRRVPKPLVVARFVDNWDLPVMSRLFEKTGNILLDRGSVSTTRRALRRAEDALRDGYSLFIFPEGTRWKEPGKLGPFHPGAFALAIETGAPVIPIVVSPLAPKTDLSRRRLDPNVVDVHVLEPISTSDYTRDQLPELRTIVRQRMTGVLTDLAHDRGLTG